MKPTLLDQMEEVLSDCEALAGDIQRKLEEAGGLVRPAEATTFKAKVERELGHCPRLGDALQNVSLIAELEGHRALADLLREALGHLDANGIDALRKAYP